jgi:acyl transferase domain-containing protein/acyl carrier protein
MSTRWGGFLPGLDRFEPSFFGISPREAATLDPQQRLFLEVACEALEDAGQLAPRLAGSRTGVYVGTHTNDYSWMLFCDASALDAYSSTGTAHSIVANRLSYVLDLRGPSVAIDTACSASLVAVHLASQGLRNRECDLALAGGVNLLLSPLWSVALSKLGMLSPDGRCKAFDARANGIVRSEGCGVIVLKRLADALADGDHVWALIRGSATNQDGRTNGLTAPNGLAQQAVVRQALADAGVEPAEIGLVEAHGTGTPLGDPIEVEALAAVLGNSGERPCLLGSAKTSIGHLEAAAGIAGLIKVVLSLHHEAVPGLVHFHELNPHINLAGTRLAIPRALQPWPRGASRRCGGVSAFGFGGSNAHVVLEEAPADVAAMAPPARRPHLLVLSARGPEGLRSLARSYQEWLADPDRDVELGSVCASAAIRRVHYPHRLAVVGASREELVARLTEMTEAFPPVPTAAPAGLAFVFSGQGTQWPAMARELLAGEPAFRRLVEACDGLIRAEAGWSLLEVLETSDEARLRRTEFAQPAIFAVEVGLAALLASWGIVPVAVAGHSVGEIAAAHVAGALTLADATRIVLHRARLMQGAEGRGRMVSVELPEAEAMRAIADLVDRVAIAAVNAPTTTVLSGDGEALAQLIAGLERRGVGCQWLPVDYAFHSPQMESLRGPLVEALRGITSSHPRVPLVSTVTARPVAAGDLVAEYWGRNLREPVRLAAAVDALAELGAGTFVELGPHPVLGGAIAKSLEACRRPGVALASLRRGQPGDAALLALVGRLWRRGHTVDWSALYPEQRRWVPLPLTPWERESHPLRLGTPAAGVAAGGTSPASAVGHPLLARRLATAQPTYEIRLDPEAPAYLDDHRINGAAIVPATALVEMALHAGAEALGATRARLEDVVIRRPLPFDGARLVQVTITGEGDGVGEFRVFSRADGQAWVLHATGRLCADGAAPGSAGRDAHRAGEALRAGTPVTRERTAHYERFRRLGADFGPAFCGVRRLWCGEGEALAEVELPSGLDDADAQTTRIHPALLDACVQVVAGSLEIDDGTLLVPMAAESIRVCGRAARAWSYARVRRQGDGAIADVVVTDDEGRLVAELRGLAFRPTSTDAELHELTWQARPLPALSGGSGTGRWLILADRAGAGEEIARHLATRGHAATVLGDGDPLPPAAAEPWTGVVHLRGLDILVREDVDGSTVQAAAVEATADALGLVQALAVSDVAPRLWLVTRGAQPVGGEAADVAVAQSVLWGFGRVVALERPELRPTLVDLDPADTGGADALVGELLAGDAEPQVALRGGVRYVARLAARRAETAVGGPPPTGLRLDVTPRGVLDNLVWVPAERTTPGPGQVAIEVQAIGLNFRDVLNALGMYPGDAGPLGSEFAGRVLARGPGVETPAVGERVMGVGVGTFATTVVTDAALVVPVPAGLSVEAAATIPIAFLTAHCALHELAGLRRGQRVLIHAAAGGVGLAAVALAQRAGAEVFATAGSPEKRALLASLGVRHVLDSRSLDFETAIDAATEGRGVDVVLNSLSGDAIPASLRVTSPGGCFVEIGKRGIWDAARVAAARPGVVYHVLYLGDLFEHEPARIQAMLRSLAAEFAAGHLVPLPRRVYPAARAADAFRFMAQARHVGKLVVTPPASAVAARVHGDATYLITGGLGALGLRTAEWLHARGARHLVLMGRSAPAPAVADRIARLGLDGTVVRVIHGDVARDEDVRAVLDEIARTLPPLRGVVHAAGVLADAVLAGQSRALIDTVLAPKVAGAWNLHTRCAAVPLDFFVLFSSIASVLGSAGQANYAAANAFLDALAAHRRLHGRHGLAVGWGPWKEGGMAASLAEHDRHRWDERGVRALPAATALAALERVLPTDAAHVMVAVVDWTRYRSHIPGGANRTLSALGAPEAAGAVVAPGPERRAVLLERLDGLPPARRSAAVLAHVREEVIRVLQLAPNHVVDPDRGLKDLGLDSLMAVELRNRLQASTGRVLPTTLAFDHPTVTAVARYLEREVLGHGVVATERTPTADDSSGLAEAVERLSDEEAGRLLLEELARARQSGHEVVGGG